MELSEKHIVSLRELLAQPRLRIVVVSHTNPDGDAVGSSLAWAEVLRSLGHEVLCIVPNKYPYFLDWMPGIDEVVIFKNDAEGRARQAVEAADVIFCLDFNAISRLENLSETIAANTTACRVLIDHHLQPDTGFDIAFSHPESSSTCYLVYRLVEALYGREAITRRMAELLYVGMMTDTGNFAFSHLTPDLFRAVADLVEKGISIPEIHNNVYNAYTEGRARLFGYAINRKMELIEDGTVAYMSLKENLRPLLEQYVASLPASPDIRKGHRVDTDAKGIVVNSFKRKMETPKAMATMVWSNENVPYTLDNMVRADIAGQVLSMVYLQKIREDAGAAYSVMAQASISRKDDKTDCGIFVYCPVEPEKADTALAIMRNEVAAMQNGCDADMLAKVKEFMLKNHDDRTKTNGYWQGVINNYRDFGLDTYTDYKKTVEAQTPQTIAAFIKELVKPGNRVEVVMMPAE